jgi:hypothetical protein
MKHIYEKSVKGLIENGFSAESEDRISPNFDLKNLLERIQKEEKLTDDDFNVIIVGLLDMYYYGEPEKDPEILTFLKIFCPPAAESIRQDSYMFKYRVLPTTPETF